jgi:aminoglycoside phosphotransferase family enzyme/predicted kinase
MTTENQAAVIDFLVTPATHGGVPVERIDTHSAVVFLAGARAWKLKRAVRFDYLDFSTPERRRAMCEAEVELNRRTAPALYRGVVPVTREADGSLAIDGSGEPVDWLVEMNRFPQEALFDRLAASGRLDPVLMGELACAVAHFHLAAARRRDHGGTKGMAWIVEGNAAAFEEFGRGILDAFASARLTTATRAELQRRNGLLDARREAGFVRQCHGDLHLRNIVLIDGRPTLFDAIEFNDEIACGDVLYDLAFLLMDLWRRELPRHANAVWNGYLAETNDFAGIALMPLFLSCRAAVHAKTSATAAHMQEDPARRCDLEEEARSYLAMAERLLHPSSPCVVAVGGLSGSGKSTMAVRLAPDIGPVPGAVVLRSDEVRKRLCGVAPLERLGPEGYRLEVSERVYTTLVLHAGEIIRAGHSVIVDAVHARPADRERIEHVATAAGVPFIGVWLDAPESALIDRLQRRERDVSDADASVVRMQLAQTIGPMAWHRVDASSEADAVLRRTAEHVRARLEHNVPALRGR